LTVTAVARQLALSERMVRLLAESGRLPALKIGKLWRFVPEDVESFIERRRSLSLQQATPAHRHT
jgi:excisionase family DNA binding protein